MVIDCDSCQVAGLACHDCVVSVLLGAPGVSEPEHETVHLEDEHARAIEALAAGGLVPPLRLRREVG